MALNPTWDEVLTWVCFVGYVLHQFSCASPVCKDSATVCMKKLWGVLKCDLKPPCRLQSLSVNLFWCDFLLSPSGRQDTQPLILAAQGKDLWSPVSEAWGEATVHRTPPGGHSSCKPKTFSGPISACRLLKHQIPNLTADKEHFYLLQKSFHLDPICKLQSNGK